MNISTLSSRYQICNRVLPAALTATESWREANESEEGVNHEKGWESSIQELNWAFFVREFGMVTVTAVMASLPWGQHSSDLQQRFHLKSGLFLWSHEMFLEVSHLQKKISLSLGSKECVILKPNTSSIGLGLFCVWHSEHCLIPLCEPFVEFRCEVS